jgi:hypothetical protein
MSKIQGVPKCWEVIGCGKQGQCQVWKMAVAGAKPCWEVVGSFDDYRSALNVCSDCLVYVLYQGKPILTQNEIADIMDRKSRITSDKGCQAFNLIQ